jgi:hypothetical protein
MAKRGEPVYSSSLCGLAASVPDRKHDTPSPGRPVAKLTALDYQFDQGQSRLPFMIFFD